MACLSNEQLAAIALRLDECEQLATHVEQCDTCQGKLAQVRRLTGQLTAAHAELDRGHAASRTRLLASVSTAEVTARPRSFWRRLRQPLEGLTIRQRLAAGGLGLSTAAGLLLLVLIVANSASSLSAMDRMVNAVREVKSYSYKLYSRDTIVRQGDTQPSTVVHTGTTYWLEPGSLFYDEKLERFEGPTPGKDGQGRLLSQFTGIHPVGAPGLMIFHAGTGRATQSMQRAYWWVPEIQPEQTPDYSPIAKLRMVREGDGRVLRELGTRMINGIQARGFVMTLTNAKPGSGYDALEVWVDPQTNLPIQFGYEFKDVKATAVFRITDCKWNIPIDPALFNTTPPEGYAEITPPTDEDDIAGFAAALQLYAELTGRYPQSPTFDPDAVHQEMLTQAGFGGMPQESWKDDPKFREVEQAAVSLRWLARVLRNKLNSGYYGPQVSPQDEDKLLLWWGTFEDKQYRVFYGDLRTEVLPLAEWAKLVPPDATETHLWEPE